MAEVQTMQEQLSASNRARFEIWIKKTAILSGDPHTDQHRADRKRACCSPRGLRQQRSEVI